VKADFVMMDAILIARKFESDCPEFVAYQGAHGYNACLSHKPFIGGEKWIVS